ncbi:MAG: 4Fe-4S binding protein, partial [Lachnospiraceae bacterium]|nr:4Fe-4S binding protein [Lachnospiraceae bacterium]
MEKQLDKELYLEYVYPDHSLFEGEAEDSGPPRESILKLGKMITDRIPQKLGIKKITKEDPEYWGLAGVLTDEEAEIALKMGVRKPKTLPEIAKLTGIPEKELEPKLQEMSVKGILEYNWENPKHEKQYLLPMYVPGSAEFFNMNNKVIEEHPEVTLFFEHMSRLPLEHVTPFVGEGGNGIGMHVIPVEKAIEMESESIDLEHISYWLTKYEGKYAASPCSCRRSRLHHDEGCGDDPEGWCVAVGDMADYVVETQKDGRYITREEALEIFKQAEDNGFVHQITNIDGANKIFAICNCNVNVCYALRTSQLFNTPNMSRSAYVAKVDKSKCVACGKCVESCPAGAVKLGQKLCKKDGSEVTYPKMPLPTEQKWGEHMWTHNYRDVNRINCYDTGTAPCKTACPAHIAIQGYLQLAKEGRYEEALALIKKDNPLPAICGRICNRRCEDACTRGTIDEA